MADILGPSANITEETLIASMEGENSCSCRPLEEAGCSGCREIHLRHQICCTRSDRDSPREVGRLHKFTMSEDCQFCFLVTRAFLRSLEAQGENELVSQIQENYRYHDMSARFSFLESYNSKWKPCDSWSSGPKNGICLRARFIQQVWGDNGGEASIGSAFFQIGLGQDSRLLLMQHEIGPSVDWQLINNWIRDCLYHHSNICQNTLGSRALSRPARIVDVHNNCIVATPPSCEYLALSYVWGQWDPANPMPTAKKSKMPSLQEPGGLSTLDLPNTILNAIEASGKIGHQYLWIDSLCIIQDDDADKAEQVSHMSDIYTGAFLTIIAAFGNSAKSGLYGVGPPRAAQHIAEFDGLEMVEVLPLLGDILQHATWRTRAWTQQEWLLSKRRLYFTNVQVYFECKTALQNEDSWVMKSKDNNTTPERSGSNGLLRSRQPSPSRRWDRFRDLMQDYTRRDLSFNNDIFNACTGIYHSVYGPTEKRFVFGLPESHFLEALRWHSEKYTARILSSEDFVIPTWSWAARQVPIEWYGGSEWLTADATGDEEDDITRSLVVLMVCVDAMEGFTPIRLEDPDVKEAVSNSKSTDIQRYPNLINMPMAKPGHLAFRTQPAMLKLESIYGRQINPDRQSLTVDIMNTNNNTIATINIPLEWARENLEETKAYERKHQCAKGYHQFQFVAISAVRFPKHWTIETLETCVKETHGDIGSGEEIRRYRGNVEKDEMWEMDREFGKHLHVMLIKKKGDVARRVGVTNIRLVDWLKGKPTMEDIVLE